MPAQNDPLSGKARQQKQNLFPFTGQADLPNVHGVNNSAWKNKRKIKESNLR